jgi:hypothetical protein
LIFIFQSNLDLKKFIAILIAIGKPIRIDRTLIIFEKGVSVEKCNAGNRKDIVILIVTGPQKENPMQLLPIMAEE